MTATSPKRTETKRTETKRTETLRATILPISIGFPFGLSAVLSVNIPLPPKIVMDVLDPIVIGRRFGEGPDISGVDAHVRGVMQHALDDLAAARRLPVIG